MDRERTDQELWEEVVRTAKTLKKIESHQVEPLEKKMALDDTISKEDIPTGLIADAQILIRLLLELEDRGAEVA